MYINVIYKDSRILQYYVKTYLLHYKLFWNVERYVNYYTKAEDFYYKYGKVS